MVFENNRVRDCVCSVERKLHARLERAGIPQRYVAKDFETYDGKLSKSAGAALLMCRRYVEEWTTRRELGMLLTGPCGVGKTHLAVAMLKGCNVQWGASIAFVDLPAFFTEVKATFNPSSDVTEHALLKRILAADILAIDEVGAARSTEWTFAMTEHILNTRYNAARSTIIANNYPNHGAGWTPAAGAGPKLVAAGNYAAMMDQPLSVMRKETLGDRIGERMFSRLQEMCIAIDIEGADQRAAIGKRRG
jgi:DNA replication protein DnaC